MTAGVEELAVPMAVTWKVSPGTMEAVFAWIELMLKGFVSEGLGGDPAQGVKVTLCWALAAAMVRISAVILFIFVCFCLLIYIYNSHIQ